MGKGVYCLVSFNYKSEDGDTGFGHQTFTADSDLLTFNGKDNFDKIKELINKNSNDLKSFVIIAVSPIGIGE